MKFIVTIILGFIKAVGSLLVGVGVLIFAITPVTLVDTFHLGFTVQKFFGLIAGGAVLCISGLLLRLAAESRLGHWMGWAALGLAVVILSAIPLWAWRKEVRSRPQVDPQQEAELRQHTAWKESIQKFAPLYDKFIHIASREYNYSPWRDRTTDRDPHLNGKVLIMAEGFGARYSTEDSTKLTRALMSALPPDLSPITLEEVGTVVVVCNEAILVYDAQTPVHYGSWVFRGITAKEVTTPGGASKEVNREAVVNEVMQYLSSLPRK